MARKTAPLAGLVALWLALGAVLAILVSGHRPETLDLVGDQYAYLYQAQSLAFDHDLVHGPEDAARWRGQAWRGPGTGLFLKRRPDGRYDYAKPVLYTLGGAPFVRLSPYRGLLYWNVCLFLALVALTWAWLARLNPWGSSAFAALVLWLGGSAVFYVFVCHADLLIAALTLASLALFGVTASSDSPPSSRLTLALGAGMGLMTYEKLTFAGFAIAAGVHLVARRHLRSSLLYAATAAALWLAPTAVHYAQDGGFSAYAGERYRAREVPFHAGPHDRGRLVPWDTDRFFRSSFLVGRGSGVGIAEGLRRRLGQMPRLASHYIAGRRGGLVPYFIPFLAALAMGVCGIWRPRHRWKLWILTPALAPVAFYFWASPGNYIGGGGTLGNRYALQLAPAFLVLCDRLPGRTALRWLALGGLTLVAVAFYPGALYGHPTTVFQRYRELLYRPAIAMWPTESELVLTGIAGAPNVVDRAPGESLVALDSPLERPFHQRTLHDGRRHRFCFVHARPRAALGFRVSAGPTPFEVSLESGAASWRERFAPWETRYLELPIAATETLWDDGEETRYAWLAFTARSSSAPVSPDGILGSLLLLEPRRERSAGGRQVLRLGPRADPGHLLWGWHEPEPEPGKRWAGSGRRSGLLVELDGGRSYTLSTEVATFIPRQGVTVSLDGEALGRVEPVPGGFLDVSVELPPVAAGPHVIELRHERQATPEAVLGTADTRELTCLYRRFVLVEVERSGGESDAP